MSLLEPTTAAVGFADARARALGGLIDYAGLFPPALLDMAGAVAGYRRGRAGDNAFMMGRFVCPAARLEELAGALIPTMTADEPPWAISALLAVDPDVPGALLEVDVRWAADFRTAMGAAATIDTVDLRLGPDADALLISRLAAAAARLGAVTPFFEVGFAPDWRESVPVALGELAVARRDRGGPLGAKVRCGGLAAELFPGVDQLALFVATCRDLELPFKATAGLHHPIRRVDPVTAFHHHGFLNLTVAAALAAAHGLDPAGIGAILADEDPVSFQVTRRAIRWRDLEAGPADVTDTRLKLFTGYGSCDFDEPAADLVALGILPLEES